MFFFLNLVFVLRSFPKRSELFEKMLFKHSAVFVVFLFVTSYKKKKIQNTKIAI